MMEKPFYQDMGDTEANPHALNVQGIQPYHPVRTHCINLACIEALEKKKKKKARYENLHIL